MAKDICDIDELEAMLGSRPLGVMMKSIPQIDDHCRAILSYSVAAVVASRGPEGMQASIVGGRPGFAGIESPTELAFDVPPGHDVGSAAALLVLTPGWRETLRVNGRLSAQGLTVEEAFLHCGKAMIRSSFWAAPGRTVTAGPTGASARLDDAHQAFLATAPFAVIGSCDPSGAADASPKGDPAGFVQMIDERTVAVPDRPGNRRTDTFHNLVELPDVALLLLSPGDDRVMEIRGRARLASDPRLLDSMAVKGRPPKVAVVVDIAHCDLRHSEVVTAAGLWDPANHVAAGLLPRATRVWTDHVKQNETSGTAAQAMRAGVNEPALRAGIDQDYRDNLY